MKNTPSMLAAVLQLLACAGFVAHTSSAKVNNSESPNGTIAERAARLRTAMIEQAKSTSDENGVQLTGWGNWHNGWRNWGNGWGKGGWGKGGAWGKGGW